MLNAILTTFPMFVCLFWTIVLAIRYKHSSREKKILTLHMFASTICFAGLFIYFNKPLSIIIYTETVFFWGYLAVYPIYYIYIKALTDSKKIVWQDFLILLPTVIIPIAAGIIYALMSPTERVHYIQNCLYDNSGIFFSPYISIQYFIHKLAVLIFVVQIVFVLYFGYRRIIKYNKDIADYYSNTEGRTFADIKIILVFFIATSLVGIIVNLIGKEYFVDNNLILVIPSVSLSVLLFSIGYAGINQNFTSLDFAREIMNEAESEKTYTSNTTYKDLATSIVTLIESEQLFLLPDLKVSDIASRLHTNRTYVHHTISKEIGLSFADLINPYRVEYAKKIIKDSLDKGMKPQISDIMYQSGFSSDSSFYRIFKQYTQMTPNKWIADRKLKQGNIN